MQSFLSRSCCSQLQIFLFQTTQLDQAQGRLKKHTEANHMIWYLSGHFAQWCNPKQEHLLFMLCSVSQWAWFTVLYFAVALNLGLVCVCDTVGIIQAAEKLHIALS